MISPPTWGWPGIEWRNPFLHSDFPTHVGMARGSCLKPATIPRFPHPRGDGPRGRLSEEQLALISPPTWGWPEPIQARRGSSPDFPTHVGMARRHHRHSQSAKRFPHPRGDGPAVLALACLANTISPPTWGWPAITLQRVSAWNDFPTHVGMARIPCIAAIAAWRFPHPRGDGPRGACGADEGGLISPPTWGWPENLDPGEVLRVDFPTHVGMARTRTARGSR